MDFHPMDLELMEFYRRKLQSKSGSCKRVWREATLLWADEHYLLIRHGVQDRCRDTYLVNRFHLLLSRGNPDKNPMVELALATIHEVHFRTALVGYTCLVHSTSPNNGILKFRKRRWSPTLLRDLIAFAEEREAEFIEKEKEWIAKFEIQNTHSQRMHGLVAALGVKIYGTIEQRGVKTPPGHTYNFKLDHWGSQDSIRFTPMSNGTVNVKANNLRLSAEEFEIFVSALAQMQALQKGENT